MATVSTNTPEQFRPTSDVGDGIYAWEENGDGDLVPSGAGGLSSGQAWAYNGDGDLAPAGSAITDDPYWEENGDGDLIPTT